MKFIEEKERRTPITDEADVVVAGGGPPGSPPPSARPVLA